MVPEGYSRNEVDLMIQGFTKNCEVVSSGIHQKVEETLTEVRKNSGRLSEVEKWQERLKGGMTILSIIVLPVALYLLYVYLDGGIHG